MKKGRGRASGVAAPSGPSAGIGGCAGQAAWEFSLKLHAMQSHQTEDWHGVG